MPIGKVLLDIHNVRCFEQAHFEFEGLNVLIGENGAGKSTVLEVFEIARKAASPGFLRDLDLAHGGYRLLARDTAAPFGFALRMTDRDKPDDVLDYELEFVAAANGLGTTFLHEWASLLQRNQAATPPNWNPVSLFKQDAHGARYYRSGKWEDANIQPERTMLSYVAAREVSGVHPSVNRIPPAVSGFELHVPFDVTPYWVGHASQRHSAARRAQMLLAANGLDTLGQNLVSVLQTLKNSSRAKWEAFLGLVRAGLDLNVDDVNIKPGAEGGTGALTVRLSSGKELAASALSNGQLAWLGWAAVLNAPQRPSVLLLDEPDAHLHPALVATLARELCEYAKDTVVIVGTHSPQFLDAVSDPAKQVTILRAGPELNVVPMKWSAEGIKRFVGRGRTVGQMRDEGILTPLEEPVVPAAPLADVTR